MRQASDFWRGAHNKSLDASGGCVSRNLLDAAEGALIRAAASTQPLCGFFWIADHLMKKPSPFRAIVRGHLSVTLPVLMIIALGGFVGRIFSGTGGLGIIVGAMLAWPAWSFLVPRWRDWVEDSGLAPDEVQSLAVRTGLLWPRGSLFERTEFRRRNGKRGW